MQAVAEHIDYKALYKQAELKIASLAFELDKLKKMIFGSKHERFVATNDKDANPQLSLDLDLYLSQVKIVQCGLNKKSKHL